MYANNLIHYTDLKYGHYVSDPFGKRSYGIIFGIVVFAATVGGSAGPVMARYIFNITGSYGMSVVGLIASITLKPMLDNFKPGFNGRSNG